MTHAWERLHRWWDIGFGVVVVVVGTVLALRGDVSTARRALSLLGLAVLCCVYAATGSSALRCDPKSRASFLAYAVPCIVLVAALLQVDPVFFVLLWIVYPQLFASAPTFRYGAVAAVALSVIWVVSSARWASTPFSGPSWWSGGVQASIGLAFSLGMGAWITGIIDESRDRATLIDELAATRAQLAAAHHQAGVLEERERLSAEIHDTLAQGFASIAMLLQAAGGGLGRDEQSVRDHLALAERTARENLAEARALVAALQPVALQSASLSDAIRRLASRCHDETGLDVTVQVDGTERLLASNDDVALLRAAQESLSNVRKHASAQSVVVRLHYDTDRTTLSVTDDGAGFDPEVSTGGFGLRGLRARLEQVGGSASVHSSAGAGTQVIVTVAR